jgi:hypothetical protein
MNVEDRFSNRLGRLLGDNYVVLNVASPGWDTGDEIKAITQYPYRPDVLILSYYINDIEGVAYDSGISPPQLRRDPPAWLAPLAQNSYAVNFVYWRVARLAFQEWAASYWAWLKEINNNPDVKWRHQQQLLTIINGAASEQIPLFVVVFPNLAATDESQAFTKPVIDLFKANGVPLLNVGELVAGYTPAQLTVNSLDSHPNEFVNAQVAQQLHQMMQAYLAAP